MGFFLITFLRKRNVKSEGGEGIFSKLVSRIIDNGDKMEELSGIVATLARGRFVLLDWKGIWDRGLISRPDSAYWLGLFSMRRGKDIRWRTEWR